MKRCSKCGVEKPISAYCRDRNTKDGHRYECKECQREYRRENKDKILEYRRVNKGTISEQRKEYRRENKKKISEYNKEFRRKNREKRSVYHKEYCRENKKKISEQRKGYFKTQNGILAHARGNHNRRALYKRERSDMTLARWARILESQNHKCNICHKRFTKKRPATQDHIIPISKNGSLLSENIQALCSSCNSTKHAKLELSFIQTWVHSGYRK